MEETKNVHRIYGQSTEHFIENDALTRRIKWKCDLKLLPPLFGLFLITFIDRTNIANAKIEGMTTELHFKPNGYNISLWSLSIPYICFSLPSNMLLKKAFVSPAVYLSGLMFCWGLLRSSRKWISLLMVFLALCTIGLGCTKNIQGVIACRFLMGMFEAGFVPGLKSNQCSDLKADMSRLCVPHWAIL